MGEGMQLITQVVIEQAGNFTMQVPADAPVVLQVVDDANSDGVPSLGERMGMREEGAVFATGIIENISLMVGVFPKKDPIEGLGVVPTPPLPDEEGDGAMPRFDSYANGWSTRNCAGTRRGKARWDNPPWARTGGT